MTPALICCLGTSSVVSTGSGNTGSGGSSNGGSTTTDSSFDPPGSIHITTSQNPSTVVSTASTGAIFYFESGIHRLSTGIVPKNNQQFWGSSDAIISGAQIVTGFSQSGGIYRATGQTYPEIVNANTGLCLSDRPRGRWTNDLFVNNDWRTHAASSAVSSSQWFFNYGADVIHLGADPSTALVEISVCPWAFGGAIDGVELHNLTIEKFASDFQHGAIEGGGQGFATNWLFDNCLFRYNHMAGIRVSDGFIIRNCDFFHNGQMGIGNGGDDVEISSCEIAYNNMVHVRPGNEAGGFKMAGTTNNWVHHNFIHHNIGPGAWWDVSNVDVLCEYNICNDQISAYLYDTSETTPSPGIMHEIGGGGIFRHNECRRNSTEFPAGWPWAGGVLIAASGEMEDFPGGPYLGSITVSSNIIEDNHSGIGLIQQSRQENDQQFYWGPYYVYNCHVFDNHIRMNQGQTGGRQDIGASDTHAEASSAIYVGRNNRFTGNHYYTDITNAWTWRDADMNWAGWQAQGQDSSGSVSSYAAWPF